MANKMKKKGRTKNTSLSIRMDDKTKKMIEQRAEKSGETTSAYVLNCILTGKNKEGYKERMAEIAAICQEICNYVEEKYGNDDIMEERIERLWELLL